MRFFLLSFALAIFGRVEANDDVAVSEEPQLPMHLTSYARASALTSKPFNQDLNAFLLLTTNSGVTEKLTFVEHVRTEDGPTHVYSYLTLDGKPKYYQCLFKQKCYEKKFGFSCPRDQACDDKTACRELTLSAP